MTKTLSSSRRRSFEYFIK